MLCEASWGGRVFLRPQGVARISELLAGGSPVALTWLLAGPSPRPPLAEGSSPYGTWASPLCSVRHGGRAGRGRERGGGGGRERTQEHNRTAACPDLTHRGHPATSAGPLQPTAPNRPWVRANRAISEAAYGNNTAISHTLPHWAELSETWA